MIFWDYIGLSRHRSLHVMQRDSTSFSLFCGWQNWDRERDEAIGQWHIWKKKSVVLLMGNESINVPCLWTQWVHSNDFGQCFLAGELICLNQYCCKSADKPRLLVGFVPANHFCVPFCMLSVLAALTPFHSWPRPGLWTMVSSEKAWFSACTAQCVIRQCWMRLLTPLHVWWEEWWEWGSQIDLLLLGSALWFQANDFISVQQDQCFNLA